MSNSTAAVPAQDLAAGASASAAAEARPRDERSASPRLVPIFAALMSAMMLSALDQTIFATALPTIVGELNGIDHMAWVTTSYILASTVMMPLYGKLGDLVGRKPLFLGAIGIFLVGSVLGALSTSMTMLIAGRAIQGLGGGGLMLLSQAIIADVVPPRERGRYMGIIGAVFAAASVAGPLLGGYFTDGPGWRWAFWINITIGLLAIAVAVRFLDLPRHRLAGRRIDIAGMVAIALSTVAFILATTWGGNTYDWLSPQIIGLVLFAVVGAVVFVRIETRAEEPIFPLHLFANREFVLATTAALITSVAMFGILAYFPTYLQMAAGVTPTVAGLLMIPLMGSLLVASITTGRLTTKTGRYRHRMVGGVLFAAFGAWTVSQMTVETPVWQICVHLGLFGLGLGAVMPLYLIVVQTAFSTKIVGTATAAHNYFRQIGATLGSSVVGSVFASRLGTLMTERFGEEARSLQSRMQAAAAAGQPPSPDDVTAAQQMKELVAGGSNALEPSQVRDFAQSLRDIVVAAYSDALTPIIFWMVPVLFVAALILLFLREVDLDTVNSSATPVDEVEHATQGSESDS